MVSTVLIENRTVRAEIMQETCTEKETPNLATRQSPKGAVPSKGEAAVSGGVVGTGHREDHGDGVRGGELTVSTREFFPVCRLGNDEDFSCRRRESA